MYELFQSGYSGQPYIESTDDNIDDRLYHINLFNQHELVNPEVVEEDKNDIKETELTAVLEGISNTYNKQNFMEIPRPWLPLLEEQILCEYEYKAFDKFNGNTAIGLIDIPTHQAQKEYKIDLENEGNIAIIGTSGSGKSVLVTSIITKLASQNKTENLKVYILDFANSGLIKLINLNHVSEYLTIDDTDKTKLLVEIMGEEFEKRKNLLIENQLSTVYQYNEQNTKKLQIITIVIDNIELLQNLTTDMYEEFVRFIKEGAKLGIHFIITANKSSDIKSSLILNFKNKILLYCEDRGEISNVLKRSEYELQDIPGRGLIINDSVVEVFQSYTPAPTYNDKQYLVELEQLIKEINKHYPSGNVAFEQMPDVIQFVEHKMINDKIYSGKSYKTFKDIVITFSTMVVGGRLKSGKTNYLKLIIEQICDTQKICIIDDGAFGLLEYSKTKNVTYVIDPEQIDYSADVFIINKFTRIDRLKQKVQQEVKEKLFMQHLQGKKIIAEVSIQGVGSAKDDFTLMLRSAPYIIYFGLPTEQNYTPVDKHKYKNEKIELSDGYIITPTNIAKIRLPKAITGNENKKFEIPGLEDFIKKQREPLEPAVVLGEKSQELLTSILSDANNKIYVVGEKINLPNVTHIEYENVDTIEDNSFLVILEIFIYM